MDSILNEHQFNNKNEITDYIKQVIPRIPQNMIALILETPNENGTNRIDELFVLKENFEDEIKELQNRYCLIPLIKGEIYILRWK